MELEDNSKAQLLAEAHALLLQDDRELAEKVRRKRGSKAVTASFIVALVLVGIATLFVALHSNSDSTTQHAQPASQVAR